MSDDYQEGYSRVRQIPIHIEGRDGNSPSSGNNTRSTQTRNTQGNIGNDGYGLQNQQHQQNQQHLYQPQYADHQASPPNVSSVNIDYRPSPPGRPITQTNHASNSGNSSKANSAKGDGQRPHSAIANASQQNSEPKLVNSPEPIPLPPPQAGQFNSEAAKAAAGLPTDQAAGEQQNQTSNLHQQQQNDDRKPMDEIDKIKTELFDLLKKITAFEGLSAKSKEYLYLDEMLTRCTLRLDNIVDPELRQKRKAAIKLIDQATDILQRKLKINSDIHDLSQNMTS